MSKVESKSRFSLNQKLIFSALIMIAVVISIPLVYAIVEPHIKITMDGAQTTKPIQIVDSQNNEVFSIDTDGTIFPDPVLNKQVLADINTGKTVLFFESASESASVSVTDGTNIDQYQVLAEWELDFTTTEVGKGILPFVNVHDGYLTGFMKKDISNEVAVRLDYHTVDEGWSNLLFISTTVNNLLIGGVSTQNGNSMCFRGFIGAVDPCTIKLVYGNTNTVGGNPTFLELEEIKFYLEITVPYGVTVTRVT